LAYLFFTQLWWKLPPTFGCPEDFAFTKANAEGRLERTSGLCDWIGVEVVYSSRPRPFFTANLDNKDAPELSIDLAPLARLNGAFLENVVQPNIRWFGYLIWGSEALIAFLLFFGLFSRLGGLIALAMSAQLMIGLAGIPDPYEWEWGYNMLVPVSLVAFAFAPGRVLGIDALLRPRLLAAAARGNRAARALLVLT
ncbi:MAG: hypothetical protein HY329_12120, partial [Chloroflexi bacterium]|nr:hypothetical protein [Chloroflexota bacterium]